MQMSKWNVYVLHMADGKPAHLPESCRLLDLNTIVITLDAGYLRGTSPPCAGLANIVSCKAGATAKRDATLRLRTSYRDQAYCSSV